MAIESSTTGGPRTGDEVWGDRLGHRVNRRAMLTSALATGIAAPNVAPGPVHAQRSISSDAAIVGGPAARQKTTERLDIPDVIVLDSPADFQMVPRDGRRQYLMASRKGGWAATSRGPIGGGIFYWDPTSTAAGDDGTIFAVPGEPIGRFVRAVYWEKEVSATWWGAQYDGVTDDSASLQSALNYLKSVGGGVLSIEGVALCSNLTIDFRNVTIQGKSRGDAILVRNGALGFHIQESWVNFRHLSIVSQGSKDDGLNTRGVLYSSAPGHSIGHVYNYDISVEGFSGIGIELRNALDCNLVSCFFRNCIIGLKVGPNGSAANDFSTTIGLDSVYAISCDIGIYAERLYRSQLNVIGEYNNVAVKINLGQITLNRCYFENNVVAGAEVSDADVFEFDTYSNDPVRDRVSRSWRAGVVAASDRGYRKQSKFDSIAKRFGILSEYGSDVEYLGAHGTTGNLGLKYGYATVALSRGPNLAVPEAWTSEAGDEFRGWDFDHDGYKISAIAPKGRCGMRQTITLSKTKRYVIDFKVTSVHGSALSTIMVGNTAVHPGIPFVPKHEGPNLVRCFGVSDHAFEVYVNVFSLAELVADVGLVADTQDRLSRRRDGRGLVFSAGPPTGAFGIGEWVREKNPSKGGYAAYVRTKQDGGTWAGIPLGMRRSEAHADSQAEDIVSLRADFNALLDKLRDAGIVAESGHGE